MSEVKKTTKTTIVVDSKLWHQVSIRAAELKITKREFLERALREALRGNLKK